MWQGLGTAKTAKETSIFQTNFPANRVLRCFQDNKRELALCRQQLLLLLLLWLKKKICIESLNVLAINYSIDNRPGPKHFGKQLKMKHGTNISLAWPVSEHMYHFISQHLELQAVSYSPSKLVGEWVYEHCYNIMNVLRGEQQWEWQWNIAVQAPQKWNKDFSLLSTSHSSFSTTKCFCPEANQGSK